MKPVKTKLLPGEGINTSFTFPSQQKINLANHHTFLLSGRMLWEKGVEICGGSLDRPTIDTL
ncbi:MAG: hypothetical protein R2825_21990 [Saprospiraceae bacterium]